MTRKSVFALGLIAATAISGAALADPNHGNGRSDSANKPAHAQNMNGGGEMAGMMGNQGGMMQNMMKMHAAMMGGMGNSGMMGGMGLGLGNMKAMLDANGDGKVSAEEARSGLTAKLAEYDADGDGTLSIAEFETLHSAMIRETMVDRFQALDNDGDGQVTEAEMIALADKMGRMQMMGERGHGADNMGPGRNMPMDTDNDDGNGSMMDNN